MKIAVLGKGNMGAPLARILSAAGHDVTGLASKDDPSEALAQADMIVLALKFEQALALLERPGISRALAGKTVIDITNPLAPDFMSLTVGHDSSGAEELARAMPGAHVVKAFNTIFAGVLADHADGKTCPFPVFVAGDDAASIDAVVGILQDMGLEAVRAGGLSNARYLEPMTEMMIQFGYGLGHGDRIGFSLSKAA